eukprot:2889489-Pleurochrysis_carterae.AAC.1
MGASGPLRLISSLEELLPYHTILAVAARGAAVCCKSCTPKAATARDLTILSAFPAHCILTGLARLQLAMRITVSRLAASENMLAPSVPAGHNDEEVQRGLDRARRQKSTFFSASSAISADELEAEAASAFQQENYDRAREMYTFMLCNGSKSAKLYGNRSAASAAMQKYEEAFADADLMLQQIYAEHPPNNAQAEPACDSARGQFHRLEVKGHYRRMCALNGLCEWKAAIQAGEQGLAIQHHSQLERQLTVAEKGLVTMCMGCGASVSTLMEEPSCVSVCLKFARRDVVRTRLNCINGSSVMLVMAELVGCNTDRMKAFSRGKMLTVHSVVHQLKELSRQGAEVKVQIVGEAVPTGVHPDAIDSLVRQHGLTRAYATQQLQRCGGDLIMAVAQTESDGLG